MSIDTAVDVKNSFTAWGRVGNMHNETRAGMKHEQRSFCVTINKVCLHLAFLFTNNCWGDLCQQEQQWSYLI